ncbi:SRPBCC domain-containing protein [Emticicia sp. BO119]|uniref:SRPBCC family protein n=1 Tax=Emticicia sp. BO119 TaxID=2757768 RepID=UPI0015F040CD|nr:SRPBCC domain-containing protein [Emticicia sp. BO119]MBA4849580.1 SRPBCC domain-containing protein [Emticicia sp. BO119]
MKTNLVFDFTVNEDNSTVDVTREFPADLETVWDAWTKAGLLDQWWAPKPWRAQTKRFDFEEGGIWLYAMIGPENEKHWSKAKYEKIKEKRFISWKDAFCDEDGEENTGMAGSFWTIIFNEENGNTTVDITIQHESSTDMQAVLDMGFKEGFTMGLDNLEELLLRR